MPLNGDGRVDLVDVSAFQNGFGVSEGARPDQDDLDGYGDVDLLDYRLLAPALGSTCPSRVLAAGRDGATVLRGTAH